MRMTTDPERPDHSAGINSINATTVDSTPARTDGSGDILNSGE